MSRNTQNTLIKNQHLAGETFFWPAGPVGILLLHGFTATTAEVRPLAVSLAAQGYTILAPLLPGHNTTPADLNSCQWGDWVEVAESAYISLREQYQMVIIGGESMGGLLALYLASQYPEIAAILAYAPALNLNLSRTNRIQLQLLAQIKPYVKKPQINDDTPWQGYTVNPLKGVIQLLKFQEVVRMKLPGITQPLLIIQGRLDPTVHPSVPDMLSSQVHSAFIELHWMENSTHVVILDQEHEEVEKITQNFITRVVGSENLRH